MNNSISDLCLILEYIKKSTNQAQLQTTLRFRTVASSWDMSSHRVHPIVEINLGSNKSRSLREHRIHGGRRLSVVTDSHRIWPCRSETTPKEGRRKYLKQDWSISFLCDTAIPAPLCLLRGSSVKSMPRILFEIQRRRTVKAYCSFEEQGVVAGAA